MGTGSCYPEGNAAGIWSRPLTLIAAMATLPKFRYDFFLNLSKSILVGLTEFECHAHCVLSYTTWIQFPALTP